MAILFRHCSCFRAETEDIQVLDYRHCSLTDVPDSVFTNERTLEELNLDANQIKDLPRPLFHCHGLRILSLNDNEIESLPPALGGLINLEEFDVSHNSILQFPDNIKGCKHLSTLNASVNPLGKLPDGLTQLVNLTQLYLNDTFLDFLPANFGRLSQLRILELRENHLKTLPKSMGRLVNLKRLDIGHNEFSELPEVVGSLQKLTELWIDSNKIMYIPDFIGNLKDLLYLDASFNRIISISYEIDGCYQLQDLHLSYNKIKELPESLGNLRGLTMLKLDENRIKSLPNTIGRLSNLQELVLSTNDLVGLPSSFGLLRNLSVLNIDENYLESLPPEIGSCNSLTILSLRTNRLHKIPHEFGHMSRLSVLNISDNFINHLPFSIAKLCKLSAIWISENQNKPLVPFQSTIDPETGQRVLTCILLPQIPREDSEDGYSDGHSTTWEDRQHKQIKFASDGRVIDQPSSLVRLPTPYPKEMKAHAKHAKNLALKHHTNDVPSEAPNCTAEESKLAQPDVTSSVMNSIPVAVKEAIITKPNSPILSTTPKSSPQLHRSSNDQSSSSLVNTTQSADSGMESGQLSNMTIAVNPVFEKSNCQEQANPPSYDDVVSSGGNAPCRPRFLASYACDNAVDRGYRSDNDFYMHDKQLGTPTPDGYHSDWEAMNRNPRFINHGLKSTIHSRTYSPNTEARNRCSPIRIIDNRNAINMLDNSPRYRGSPIPPAYLVMNSNRTSPLVNNVGSSSSNISSPTPSSNSLHQPRQPPDYNTALQRSSLYSKFHGPIDVGMSDRSTNISASPQSLIYRMDAKPNSRSSHASDSGSNNFDPRMPNGCFSAAINNTSPIVPAAETYNVHKAMPAQIISDEGVNANPTSGCDPNRGSKQLGFTPISPAPNFQINNHIVRPSIPPQQFPKKTPSGQWVFGNHKNTKVFPVVIEQNPDMGFTITSNSSNHSSSTGIFVETVVMDGPASSALKPGDKILEVDGIDFNWLDREKAVSLLKLCKNTVCLMISRES